MAGWLRDTAEQDLPTTRCPSDGVWQPPQVFIALVISRSLCAIQVQKEQWKSGDKCDIMNPEPEFLQRESGHRDRQPVSMLSVARGKESLHPGNTMYGTVGGPRMLLPRGYPTLQPPICHTPPNVPSVYRTLLHRRS